ncbi:type II secretion system protein GspL [Thalassotalea fusca]
MAESLIIRLGSNATDGVQWLIWSAGDAEIIASGELPNAMHLTELTEKASLRPVVALVPACDVAFKRLKVPAKSPRAMKLAAPYMLEDDLAQDVEQLFFAYGSPNLDDDDNNCFLTAVDRQQMALWLSWLSDANIQVQKLIPDALLLPEHEGSWSCVELFGQVLAKQDAWFATAIEHELFDTLLGRWSSKSDKGESIKLHGYSPINIPEHLSTIELVSEPEELPLALLAKNIASIKFNLLQGEFQVKRKRSSTNKVWLVAASVAAFTLLTNLGLKSVKMWQINAQQAQLEQQIIDTYKQAFPETKRVRISTIRSQLKRKMAEVGGGSDEQNFLVMINKLQPAFSQVSNLKPDSLKFDAKRNEIRLQATGKSYQEFEQFKALLEKEQLNVSQGAQNNHGESISGSFSITTSSTRSR